MPRRGGGGNLELRGNRGSTTGVMKTLVSEKQMRWFDRSVLYRWIDAEFIWDFGSVNNYIPRQHSG